MIPSIATAPKDAVTKLGNTVFFTCYGIGIPQPIIEWFVGAQRVGVGHTLPIYNVSYNNAGIYTCKVKNSAGSSAATAALNVFGEGT